MVAKSIVSGFITSSQGESTYYPLYQGGETLCSKKKVITFWSKSSKSSSLIDQSVHAFLVWEYVIYFHEHCDKPSYSKVTPEFW